MQIFRDFAKDINFGDYTGREKKAIITYVTNFQQKEGWVVFGLRFIEDDRNYDITLTTR